MLNFLFFFGVLALSGVIFRTLWRAAVSPVNKYFVLHNTPTGFVQIGWLLLQIYIVFGWAGLCVSLTHLFIAKPGVVLWFGYYVLAFFGCAAPLSDPNPGSVNTIAWFAMISFIIFSIFSKLTLPWQWFLHFI